MLTETCTWPKWIVSLYVSLSPGANQCWEIQTYPASLNLAQILRAVPILEPLIKLWACSGGSDGKESSCNAGNPGVILGSGRSPGEGNGYSFQYSCLENSMDRGAWQSTVYGGLKESDTGHHWATNNITFFLFQLHWKLASSTQACFCYFLAEVIPKSTLQLLINP